MAKKINTKTKKKDNSGFIAILIVALVLLCGVIFTFIALNRNSSSIVEKPEVSIPIGTKNPQIYTAKMSFEGNVDKLKEISNDEYKLIVSEALNAVGEEKLASSESSEYVKEEMKEKLIERLNSDDFEIKAIYIDKLISSKYSPSNNNKPNSKDVADMFKTQQNKKDKGTSKN